MDFGVARTQSEARTLVTVADSSLGTPAYMAPEQILAGDAESVGPACDVYGLCATFYELFTGRRIHDHDRQSVEVVRLEKLSGRAPAAPRALRPSLPWEVDVLLRGATAPRGRRPAGLDGGARAGPGARAPRRADRVHAAVGLAARAARLPATPHRREPRGGVPGARARRRVEVPRRRPRRAGADPEGAAGDRRPARPRRQERRADAAQPVHRLRGDGSRPSGHSGGATPRCGARVRAGRPAAPRGVRRSDPRCDEPS